MAVLKLKLRASLPKGFRGWGLVKHSHISAAVTRLGDPRPKTIPIPSPTGRGLGEGLRATQISLSSQVRGTEPRAVATGIKKPPTTTRRTSCVTILLSDESLSRSLPLSVLYQVHSTSHYRARKLSSPALLTR